METHKEKRFKKRNIKKKHWRHKVSESETLYFLKIEIVYKSKRSFKDFTTFCAVSGLKERTLNGFGLPINCTK